VTPYEDLRGIVHGGDLLRGGEEVVAVCPGSGAVARVKSLRRLCPAGAPDIPGRTRFSTWIAAFGEIRQERTDLAPGMYPAVCPPCGGESRFTPVVEDLDAPAGLDELSLHRSETGLHLRTGEAVTEVREPQCQVYHRYTVRRILRIAPLRDWRV